MNYMTEIHTIVFLLWLNTIATLVMLLVISSRLAKIIKLLTPKS